MSGSHTTPTYFLFVLLLEQQRSREPSVSAIGLERTNCHPHRSMSGWGVAEPQRRSFGMNQWFSAATRTPLSTSRCGQGQHRKIQYPTVLWLKFVYRVVMDSLQHLLQSLGARWSTQNYWKETSRFFTSSSRSTNWATSDKHDLSFNDFCALRGWEYVADISRAWDAPAPVAFLPTADQPPPLQILHFLSLTLNPPITSRSSVIFTPRRIHRFALPQAPVKTHPNKNINSSGNSAAAHKPILLSWNFELRGFLSGTGNMLELGQCNEDEDAVVLTTHLGVSNIFNFRRVAPRPALMSEPVAGRPLCETYAVTGPGEDLTQCCSGVVRLTLFRRIGTVGPSDPPIGTDKDSTTLVLCPRVKGDILSPSSARVKGDIAFILCPKCEKELCFAQGCGENNASVQQPPNILWIINDGIKYRQRVMLMYVVPVDCHSWSQVCYKHLIIDNLFLKFWHYWLCKGRQSRSNISYVTFFSFLFCNKNLDFLFFVTNKILK